VQGRRLRSLGMEQNLLYAVRLNGT